MPNFNSRQYSVVVHVDAKNDLEHLWLENEEAAAIIFVFLEELQDNQEILDNLTRNKFVHESEPHYDVQMWVRQQQKKRNLWRLKVWSFEGDLVNYRVVYAFHPQENRYYVLGIPSRDFNYDASNPVSIRILKAYDALDIPKY
jgi:mRNA-degrading endonuclease RelE of RelBE toxin-antitoxin system